MKGGSWGCVTGQLLRGFSGRVEVINLFTYRDLGQTAMALEHCRAALTAYETLDDDKAGFIREFLHQLQST